MYLVSRTNLIFRHNASLQVCTKRNGFSESFSGRKKASPLRNSAMHKRFQVTKKAPLLEEVVEPLVVPRKIYAEVDFENQETRPSRHFISNILDQFAREKQIQEQAAEHNICQSLFPKVFQSFRLYCCGGSNNNGNFTLHHLEPGLQVLLSDILQYGQSVHQLFPYFVKHAHKVFPHLECLSDLQKLSDLTQPHNWYPLARDIHRKIVFHAGPTNSGKTYEALQVFKAAKTGMYCGPLRLLALEIYERINKEGIPCDMITGERRLYAYSKDQPANHCAFTVEMFSPIDRREVCVIDEIQMLRDTERGAAWTRALLGAAVNEVHLCGEEAAIDIVIKLLDPIGEHVDVRRYKRKGDLVVINTHGLRDLANVQDGDCLIHFNKTTILNQARTLRTKYKKDCAVVFGDLPPETKRAQIARFNDPNNSCKLLLATDAIGMGMNLDIKRVIFSTLTTSNGTIFPAYFVKQIAGRAGRFASTYCTGEVIALKDEDAKLLDRLMHDSISPIKHVGIGPSFDVIEMISMHIPQYNLVKLLEVFVSLCTVSDEFFLCMSSQIIEIAALIEHIPLSLRDRYTFCICPINSRRIQPFLNSSYVKMVRRYSQGNAIVFDWIYNLVEPKMRLVDKIDKLNELVEVYEFIYAYLWLSYRFEEYFSDRELVFELQERCGELITTSLENMINVKENEKQNLQIPRVLEKMEREVKYVEEQISLNKKPLEEKNAQIVQEKESWKEKNAIGKLLRSRVAKKDLQIPRVLEKMEHEAKYVEGQISLNKKLLEEKNAQIVHEKESWKGKNVIDKLLRSRVGKKNLQIPRVLEKNMPLKEKNSINFCDLLNKLRQEKIK